jgi:outer membrane protein OmpA-like peptidoglycan-associated protein
MFPSPRSFFRHKEYGIMKNRFVLLGSALVLALPLAAHAETQGFYIGGAGGADFAVDANASTGAGHNRVHYDTGPTGSLSVGYGFGAYGLGAFRAELEGAYRSNDVSGTTGAFDSTGGGHARTWSALVNGFYDINTGTRFTPYIGAGIGAANVHASLGGVYSGSDTTLAYQGVGGVAYALTPNLSLTADYRYVATTDASFNSGGARWNVENANHVVTAGLRWTFGPSVQVAEASQAAVVESAPAAPPPVDYMVYFDWDKSNLNADARSVVAQAATAAGNNKATVLLVTGNTDTTGSNNYNQKLSERRAAVVKRELIHLGISPDSIQTVGNGKTDLAVQTGDEVRERANRRTHIILRVG